MLEFVVQSFILVILIFLPGFFFLRLFSFTKILSLCLAPVITTSLFCIEAVAFSLIGIQCNGIVLFLPLILVCILAYLATRFTRLRDARKTTLKKKSNWAIFLIYICLSVLLVSYFYLRNLSDLDSIIQGYDTVYHVGLVRSFIESGNYSFLEASLYPLETTSFTPPMQDSSFYPAAWHIITASLISISNTSVGFAVNVVNFVICAIIFPAGMFALNKSIFKGNTLAVVTGSFLTLAFLSYPWVMVLRGEQYPQLFGFALLPAALTLLITCAKPMLFCRIRVSYIVCFILALSALAFSQTNVVFSAGVFCAFYIVGTIYRIIEKGRFLRKLYVRILVAFVAFVCLAWIFMYFSPMLRSVVSFVWDPYSSPIQGIINWLTLSLNQDSQQQLLLSGFVLFGLFAACLNRKYIWLAFLYLFVGIMYVVDVSTSGIVKQFLTGFWYTDYDRISAMVAIFGIPLACLGVSNFIRLVFRLLVATNLSNRSSKQVRRFSSTFICLLSVLILFTPNYFVAQKEVTTPFGALNERFKYLNGDQFESIFNRSEQEFINKAQSVIEPDSVIISIPDDGSCFAYGFDNLNLYYRRHYIHGVGSTSEYDSETSTSKIIRQNLNMYATDRDVQSAVSEVNAKYVLILDDPDTSEDETLFHDYLSEDWCGIEAIDSNTPGFKLLLSEGDMYLYEIEHYKSELNDMENQNAIFFNNCSSLQ